MTIVQKDEKKRQKFDFEKWNQSLQHFFPHASF